MKSFFVFLGKMFDAMIEARELQARMHARRYRVWR